MKKTICLFLTMMIMLFSLTGCYSSIDIDKFYYIVALGIDTTESNMLQISIQIASGSSGSSQDSSSGSSQSSRYQIYTVEAESIDAGITVLNNYLSKKINLSHCSALVFSEELAKNGLGNYISTLNNNTELRHSCNVLISSGSALDVLNNVSTSGEVFSSRLYDYLINSSDYTGYTIDSTFGTFYRELQNSYKEPSAIYTKVIDDTVQNAGTAIFNEDIMVGWINVIDTMAHSIITNEMNSCDFSVDSPFKENEKIDLQAKLYKKTKIDIQMINNTPYITIHVYPGATIWNSNKHFDYTLNENIEKVENASNSYLEMIVKNYLYTISKTYHSDIDGFTGIYSSHFLTEKDFNQVHFKDTFRDAVFEVNVHTQINSSNLFNKQ